MGIRDGWSVGSKIGVEMGVAMDYFLHKPGTPTVDLCFIVQQVDPRLSYFRESNPATKHFSNWTQRVSTVHGSRQPFRF